MSIEWSEDLAIGVTEIDAQHRELFNRFGQLLASCSDGKGKDEVLRLIDFLGEYVKSHFATEETLMLKNGYPSYQEHKGQHRAFTVDVDRLKSEVAEDGATLSLVILTNRTLVGWLVQHISKSDMEFARYLDGK